MRAGDADLRREVEALLASPDGPANAQATSALDIGAEAPTRRSALSLVGKTLGPHPVQSLLGWVQDLDRRLKPAGSP